MAKLYFITGKGGTGKTSLARLWARRESAKGRPVLLLRLDSFSMNQKGDPEPIAVTNFLWEQRLMIHAVVEEYFKVNLAKIPVPGALQRVALKIQDGITERLLSNRFVMRFIESCPGLIPTILLGKLCHEARVGSVPDSTSEEDRQTKWGLVIVDAPSTGQALQIFESARTLSKVLNQGLIQHHITETLNFVYKEDFSIQLVSLAEEGPVQECLETVQRLKNLKLPVQQVWVNKVSPRAEKSKLQSVETHDELLKKALSTELDRIEDQELVLARFEKDLATTPLRRIYEHLSDEDFCVNGELS